MARPQFSFAVALALLAASGTASGQTFSSTKVVETGVNYPGIGTYSSFYLQNGVGLRSSISGNNVAFSGLLTNGLPALGLSSSGTISQIASTSTSIPGGSGNFTAFSVSPVSLSGSTYAFGGSGTPGPFNSGSYANVGTNNDLESVVNLGMLYPGNGNVLSFSVAAVSGNRFVFSATNLPGPPIAVFTRTLNGGQLGNFATIANTSTMMPGGGGSFNSFTDQLGSPYLPNISGSNIVFGGRNQNASRFGLYMSSGSSITAVATNATPIPNGTGNFTAVSRVPAISGSVVAFQASGSNGLSGVYRWEAGSGVTRIADTNTFVPGTSDLFTSFQEADVAVSGTRVAFRGTSNSITGIYTDLTGSLTKVVATGDILDGKIVDNVNIGQFSMDGNNIAVLVSFSNGTDGIYTFTPVPEPTSLLAIGAVGLIAARLRQRSRATA